VAFFLGFLAYFSYFFVVFLYARKMVHYLKMPLHLRWELYPLGFKEKLKFFMEYFTFSEYFKRKKTYWVFLYPWHIGFMALILFHFLCCLSCLLGSGEVFFSITTSVAVISFLSGLFGAIGLFIKRLKDSDLRPYTTFKEFFTYLFTLLLFSSGLFVVFLDPFFREYRHFWDGLLNFDFINVSKGLTFHIIIFSLFLIYLPFTRSVHYLTKILGFFLIRWDNKPNRKGGKIEKLMEKELQRRISWSGSQIKEGLSWKENIFSNEDTRFF